MQWFLFLFSLLLWSWEMELPATILEKLFFHKKAFIYVCNAFSWNTLSISSPPILPLSTNTFPSQCILFNLLGKLFLNYVSFKLLKMFLKHSGIDWFQSSRQALYQLSHISSSACDFNLLFSPVCFWGEGPEEKNDPKVKCGFIHLPTYVYMKAKDWVCGCLSLSLSVLFLLRQELSLNLDLAALARLAVQ